MCILTKYFCPDKRNQCQNMSGSASVFIILEVSCVTTKLIVVFLILLTHRPKPQVEVAYLKPLRARVSLACRIQKISFRQGKASQKQSWFSRTAKALDVVLDEDLYPVSRSIQLQLAYCSMWTR